MKKLTWKRSFFILLLLNLVIFLFFIVMIKLPIENNPLSVPNESVDKEAGLKIEAKKEDLNDLINTFIEKEKKDSTIDYAVKLTDEVELYGSIPIFNDSIDMKLTFEPKALENGDLMLTQKSVSIGKLQLPVTYILNFMKKSYNFPKWVEIYPNQEIIYVHLTDIELDNNLKIYANEFDLNNDAISFSLVMEE